METRGSRCPQVDVASSSSCTGININFKWSIKPHNTKRRLTSLNQVSKHSELSYGSQTKQKINSVAHALQLSLLTTCPIRASVASITTKHVDVAVGEDVTVLVAGVALDDHRSAVCLQRTAGQVLEVPGPRRPLLAHPPKRHGRPVRTQTEVARKVVSCIQTNMASRPSYAHHASLGDNRRR